MSWFPPPKEIPSRVWARLPERLRPEPWVSDWSRADAPVPGHPVARA